ncbi:MAG: mechanosensitive ion channel [Treponema sp.]|jgi:small conductance mechanosensitive channel|nr:mechanosensitive ion channel [Treponema sp.]
MADIIVDFWNKNYSSIFSISKNIIASFIVFIVCMLISKGLKRLIRKACESRLHLDTAVSSILIYVVKYGMAIICIITILNIFKINTTSLLAILGAAGIAIGLALKDTLGNIASGIILFFLGSYRHDEFIEFGSYSGTVKEMNLFTTVLETPDGLYISAPNSSIWGTPLRNFTRNGKRRMELPVRISYSDSVDKVFDILKNVIDSEKKFLKEPAPQIIVQSLQDSHVNLCIRAWANNQDYWDVYWTQMRNIKKMIEDAGFQVPFPKRDVHILQETRAAESAVVA